MNRAMDEHFPKRGAELRELASLFLRLGTTAFGGPAAHIAMMQDEVVHRRKWLTQEDFLDLVGATNLIPGPNSTELAIHIGHRRAGWPGLLVAGFCFIFPATLIVTLIAWSYVRFGKLPQIAGMLYGIKPVIIAIVLLALWRLAETAMKTRLLAIACFFGVVLSLFGVNELAILFGTGAFFLMVEMLHRRLDGKVDCMIPVLAGIANVPAATATAGTAFGLGPLFFSFLKIGSVLFGSGYVLLAFLRADLVENRGWLTEGQLLDAIAVGQITPGPVFTAATFVGFVLGGAPGALVATIGIFLPAFFFVAISGPLIPRIRKSRSARAFLDGLNVASLALMAVVTWQLGRAALLDWLTILLAGISVVLLFRFKINSAWLIAGGGAVGAIKLLAG